MAALPLGKHSWHPGRKSLDFCHCPAAGLMVSAENTSWSAADSAALYGIDRWGYPYFSVNARGHISVQPKGERGKP